MSRCRSQARDHEESKCPQAEVDLVLRGLTIVSRVHIKRKCLFRPVLVSQNWVLNSRPPYVSAQQESTILGSAFAEQDKTPDVCGCVGMMQV